MKAKKYTLIINTANGVCLTPQKCSSLSEAIREGKNGCGFAFRIFDESGKLIKRGFCD